ncbi:SMC-Scp complex subunit ScpB [Rhodopirellula halodulae]|uniref:SMC-Scp complex subunit ScpB n=1 Tax=Rhodopirellula halodulae TaxID=2894198 RepID=UPI001E42092D|nr:SMC-Scp complex subunit ScpB [Rhodopirellula sp. JC737]MCC9654330.1 SMC-Scp complex subunit ScpB [Rhodopirellula sp. JC737]
MNGYATPWKRGPSSGVAGIAASRTTPQASAWTSPTQGHRTATQLAGAALRRLLTGNGQSTRRSASFDQPFGQENAESMAGVDAGSNGHSSDANPAADTDAVDPEDRLAARARVEGVLLIAKSPLNYRRLAALANVEDATSARTLVGELNELYERMGRGIRIEQVAGGQRMMTRSVVAPWLRRLGFLAPAVRLSWPMMETLAVVAYRQDVTRADIEAVRGVACGEILRQLMQLDLVRISGRSEELGRPYLYGTTKRFLKICGLASIKSLPPIDWHASCDDVSESDDGLDETVVQDENVDEVTSRENSQTESHPRRESSADQSETDPSATENLHPTKESDVSIAATETLATEFTASLDADLSGGVAVLDAPVADEGTSSADPTAVIEDEEDDLYENGFDLDDDEDDDFDDDDWDDEDDEEDEDEDDDEESDDLDDEDDDLDGTDDWEEVDDDDADEDWEDDDDDLDEEDEDWED